MNAQAKPLHPPTRLEALRRWVDDVARLTRPDAVHWCDGSDAEHAALIAKMEADGTLVPRSQPGAVIHDVEVRASEGQACGGHACGRRGRSHLRRGGREANWDRDRIAHRARRHPRLQREGAGRHGPLRCEQRGGVHVADFLVRARDGRRCGPTAVGTVYVGGPEADPVAGADAPTGRQIAHLGLVTQQVSRKTL